MTAATGIQFQLVSRASLTDTQKNDMFRLLERHFDGVTHGQFARDLAEKKLPRKNIRGTTPKYKLLKIKFG